MRNIYTVQGGKAILSHEMRPRRRQEFTGGGAVDLRERHWGTVDPENECQVSSSQKLKENDSVVSFLPVA